MVADSAGFRESEESEHLQTLLRVALKHLIFKILGSFKLGLKKWIKAN